MRTTLTIRDDLHEAVRRRAFEERRTLGDVMNEVIERGLQPVHGPAPRTLGAFRGQITIADDFDAPLDDIEQLLEQSIEP